MLESEKNSIVQLDSRPKHRAKRNQQLRQKPSIYPELLCWNTLCVLKKEKDITSPRFGLKLIQKRSRLIKAGQGVPYLKPEVFFFPFLIHYQKISCLSFLPFAHYFSKKKKKEKEKSQFDLIGFHLSLPGNKK